MEQDLKIKEILIEKKYDYACRLFDIERNIILFTQNKINHLDIIVYAIMLQEFNNIYHKFDMVVYELNKIEK
jgi:hypothetical protein